MAKIARFNGDVRAFGSTATGTDRTIFGDTTQSDLLDDNLTANFLTGWGILAAGAKPPKEYFNGALYTATQFIAYLHEQGVAEWNTSQKYYIGSLARGSDNVVYSSVTGTDPTPNTGTDPSAVTDGTVWKIAANPYLNETVTHDITVDADYTLTAAQNKYGRVVITDTGVLLTVARNIVVDNVQKNFIAVNSTLQDLTFKTSAGTGILVSAGTSEKLYNDGTNIISSSTKKILQEVNFTTGTFATGTTIIPVDNTIPQITEGTQFMSLAFTPKDANSLLRIDVKTTGTISTVGGFVSALFRDAVADAIGVSQIAVSTANFVMQDYFTVFVPATAAALTTFTVRCGGSTASTTTFNGAASAQLMGGAYVSSITITEIAQ